MAEIYPLRGRTRHYDWGGSEYLAALLDQPASGDSTAEYWLGTHPSDPSEVLIAGRWRSLATEIAEQPQTWLGARAADVFGELPFLFKVLDVARPLSIQVHPNREQAVRGYEREEALGLPSHAASRNFKDRNHKPEFAVALGDFWLLHGFGKPSDIAASLIRFPSLQPLADKLLTGGIAAVFAEVMTARPSQLRTWLEPAFEEADSRHASPHDAAFWLKRWADLNPAPERRFDRGVFGFLLMNIIHLADGEGIFQAANVPHAYLDGQCIEIMANSDNVLRGGLTAKHVDVAGLIEHIDFSAAAPRVIPGEETVYSTPCAEFELRRLVIDAAQSAHCGSPSFQILLVLKGEISIGPDTLRRGQAIAVRPDRQITLRAGASTGAVVFQAGIPDSSSTDARGQAPAR